MKLSSKGRYAVMALADLAKFNLNEPVSLRDISLRQGISLVYLEQLFSKLKKNKIVTSVRGNKGGYILSKQASEIKISDVFIITVYSRPKYSYMLQIMSFALEIYHLLIYSWLLVPSYKTYIVEAYYKTEDDFYFLGNIQLL